MDWDALLAKKVKPPLLPVIKMPKDVSNFDEEFTRLKPILTLPRTTCILTAEQQEIFADFDFSLMSWPGNFPSVLPHHCDKQFLIISPFICYETLLIEGAEKIKFCLFYPVPHLQLHNISGLFTTTRYKVPQILSSSAKLAHRLSKFTTRTVAGSDS